MSAGRLTGPVNWGSSRRRAGPGHRQRGVTRARPTAAGRTVPNHAWSYGRLPGATAFLVGYEWMVAYGGRVYGIWAEVAPDAYQLRPRPGAPARSGPPRALTILKVGSADFTGRR